ncbi:HBR263Cp [Eremothecium sinecaudum]|uniref:HBR263Cp n=1 Tax=Eremothecium sinecaudum TaxID=45286 RepID=A0A109UX74_9SACH|nr:HBR263Cp [Eremothecium sinecaudum]AMD19164.1 HBR263Cp [Eremothecium sinecaudum]
MSLFNNEAEEPQRYSDNPEFEEWSTQIATNLFQMNAQLGTLQQFIKGLETNYKNGKSTTQVVNNINTKAVNIIDKLSETSKVLNGLVRKVHDVDVGDLKREQVISREKLSRDVKYSVQEFQKYQVQFKTITKKINEDAKNVLEQQKHQLEEDENTDTRQGSNTALLNSVVIEREPINNEEFAYQQNLIRIRDEEIANIERGISELNDVFQDLGTIVRQQGAMVDNIEANIYSTLSDTRQGRNELDRALRNQRSSGRLCLYVLLFFLAFHILVVLVI